MGYLYGIGGVLIFQTAFTYIIILTTSGNGSFVGLGAMLLGLFGIPITAIINFVFIQESRKNPGRSYLARLLLLALVLPVIQLGLLVLVSVFRL